MTTNHGNNSNMLPRRSNLSTTSVNTTFFGLGGERYFLYCALWLGFAFLNMAMTGRDTFSYYRLRKEGILAVGTAVAKAPHEGVIYSFKLDGVAYQGAGTAGFGTAPFEQVRIGDNLPVYYLSKDPKIN